MVKIERESENTVKITHTGKLYSVETAGIVVIAPMRPKSCQVSFWTEEEYAKAVEQAIRKAEREAKKQCPKHLDKIEGAKCGKQKMGEEPGEASDGVECEECPYIESDATNDNSLTKEDK